ncbi:MULTISPECIES: hypothetical protein [Bombella]|uniref:Pentapeptide MXKDX repeat protein n=1 Tax=Bombella pollinis TaxID=2967337 RepID=A0ABT3WLB7_9PROT|nr:MULTISPECIES: hypothetical protein [Bombella]MCX5619884.1 hypothetical protein [Bombella pollinis]MUG04594.1 hypothetical protein [Bombella sp. ESL0378]MUG90088.1 hypothetical protein [Bombella sp. ESL0385]
MKKLSLSAIALLGLTAAAAPAFAADEAAAPAPAHHAHHAGHHHHGKKCGMKHGQKKDEGKAPQATDDLNSTSLDKARPAAPAASAPEAAPAPAANTGVSDANSKH